MAYTSEDLERFKSYEKVHLRGTGDLQSVRDKVEALQKKNRNKGYLFLFNILAVVFFTYSYITDITALSDTIYVILLVVFTVNVGLIYLQKRQINELIDFYESR
ncbi:MAG: hypothetical protein WEC12_01005 [Balneolaceae bacterium]